MTMFTPWQCDCSSCRAARTCAYLAVMILVVLAIALCNVGCISRQYSVNVWGDAPLEIHIDAAVSHETDASLPITAKVK